MATYSYTISSDFGGVAPKYSQLQSEITSDVGIAPTVTGIDSLADSVNINFDSALSAGEQTTLDSLVSSHTPDTSKPHANFFTITPKRSEANTSSYQTMHKFKYPGSDSSGTIDYAEVVSYMDSGVTSYSVRIYDKNNNLALAEKTGLTNTDEAANDLGAVSNVPTSSAILELQIKCVGGNKKKQVHCESAMIYHNN